MATPFPSFCFGDREARAPKCLNAMYWDPRPENTRQNFLHSISRKDHFPKNIPRPEIKLYFSTQVFMWTGSNLRMFLSQLFYLHLEHVEWCTACMHMRDTCIDGLMTTPGSTCWIHVCVYGPIQMTMVMGLNEWMDGIHRSHAMPRWPESLDSAMMMELGLGVRHYTF